MVNHRLTMFGDQWASASGNIKYLICHLGSQDQRNEGCVCACFYLVAYAFRVNIHFVIAWISRITLLKTSTISEIKVTATGAYHRNCGNGDIKVLAGLLILQDHVIKILVTLWQKLDSTGRDS